MSRARRRYAQGPELLDGGVDFRVWAPEHRGVELVLDGRPRPLPLREEDDGYWSLFVEQAKPGDRYRYRLDGSPPDFPDPAARCLPDGPHAAAQIVAPGESFPWSDGGWGGIARDRQVLYELHVGTFSPGGTWAGVEDKLTWLRDLGVTTLEIMPIAEFAGPFGWGYDGVAWFAPYHVYGTPDDFRRVVDRAHGLGLAVILDVVYNHFGGSGDYSGKYSRFYMSEQDTEWGKALNYDGPHSTGMRALAIDNAAYWIREFHLDGLRLDATQAIADSSPEHVVTALTRAARAAAPGRRIFVVAENEPQDARMLREHELPGVATGLDALWNDDLHHSMRVALTGRRHAYFHDYQGTAREWCAAASGGFLYQGQRYDWQNEPRGRDTRGLPLASFVAFLENHDQVANSLTATRLCPQSQPAQYRALTALVLLGPWTPMLFQGQEWGSSAPFHYFAGHDGELAAMVRRGRAEFLAQFVGAAKHAELLRDPAEPATFADSRLRWHEQGEPVHDRLLRLHRDLLRLRREDPSLGVTDTNIVDLDAVALTPSCALLRYFQRDPSRDADDRIMLVNLGADFELNAFIDPLLAPVCPDRLPHWKAIWSSEDPSYGGHDCSEAEQPDGRWLVPGVATVVLAPSTTPNPLRPKGTAAGDAGHE